MNRITAYLSFLYFLTLIELLFYTATVVFSFKRRSRFALRLVLSLIVLVLFTIAIGFAHGSLLKNTNNYGMGLLEVLRVLMNLLIFGSVIGALLICFDEKPILLIYAAIAGKAIQSVFVSLYNIATTATNSYTVYVFLLDEIDIWSVISYIVLFIITGIGAFFLFGRHFSKAKKTFNKAVNRYIIVVFLTLLLFVVLLQNSNIINITYNSSVIIVFSIFSVVFLLFMLLVMRYMLYWVNDITEKNDFAMFHESYKKQAEITKRSMEIVNIKCHDMKHQIHGLLGSLNLDEGFVNEVQQAIEIYDTSICTGNEYLDVVLTEKSLVCDVNKIEMTAMLDGGALQFMSISDINSFFGNAIDNCVEYLVRAESPENRFIRISSRSITGFLIIRIENYCSQKPEFDQAGLPITVKQDKENHGFGVRSIKSVVEKHSGVLSYSAEDNLFILSAMFPV